MDPSELLNLLEVQSALRVKVDEANSAVLNKKKNRNRNRVPIKSNHFFFIIKISFSRQLNVLRSS